MIPGTIDKGMSRHKSYNCCFRVAQDTRPLVNSRPSDILDTQSLKTNDA